MKKEIFLHSVIFRLLAPLFYGMLVYFLILLIFDSLDQLRVNIFSADIIVTILLTYVFFSSMRQNIIQLDKKLSLKTNTKQRVIAQFVNGILLSLIFTNLVIISYFTYFFHYTLSSFSTELITFNIIFVLSGIFYNMLYLSVYFLHQRNEIKIRKENMLKENLEAELQSFKRELNPELFFTGLETLVTLVHFSKEEADKFIKKFSDIYRYILDNKKKELVDLNKDLDNFNNLLYILNTRYENNIIFNCRIPENHQTLKIIPCTLQILLENAVFYNIISSVQALKIECTLEDHNLLVFSNSYNPKLININRNNGIKNLEKPYLYYTSKKIFKEIKDRQFRVKIPLIKVEDLEYVE